MPSALPGVTLIGTLTSGTGDYHIPSGGASGQKKSPKTQNFPKKPENARKCREMAKNGVVTILGGVLLYPLSLVNL